ncbi:uncharacterized protein RCC_10942 [Ramularia collo-cygni]|uniref:Mitochondrial carrier protein pet8 n=1 Tax=Ramularia collo-cygni TaxID=112498 RepID=A0A2D3VAW3_9PEZI|nr:uncharacterized protein RCC_10942 [Ramularia collo-cygni]CZT25213.1 uncharacterized protein RCC_10942 [Ramularia collo-cygni]
MSAFRTALTMRSAAFPAVRRAGVAPSRSFQSCRVMAAGKETKEGNAERAEEIEKSKQQQLKDGKWTDKLASDSESSVKADRGEFGKGQSIEEMQKETAKAAKEEKQ